MPTVEIVVAALGAAPTAPAAPVRASLLVASVVSAVSVTAPAWARVPRIEAEPVWSVIAIANDAPMPTFDAGAPPDAGVSAGFAVAVLAARDVELEVRSPVPRSAVAPVGTSAELCWLTTLSASEPATFTLPPPPAPATAVAP